MTELRKTGANEYDVVANGQVIGRVWNWHGSWSAEANAKAHHGLKSRKEAIAKIGQIQRPK
jgi:hypothetical protein